MEKNPKKITSFANSLEKNFFLKVNRNAKIIFLSSDMVYSGKRSLYLDNSKTLPQNNYGKSKKVVEELTKKYFNNYLILRLSKIFSVSSNDKTMYSEIINSIKKKKYLRLFNNQYVHYLDLRDFLNCFKKLISKINKLKGTFNFPGRKYTTRYKFAMEIIKKKRLDTKYLIPINVQDKKIRIPLKIKMRTNLFHKVNFVHKY